MQRRQFSLRALLILVTLACVVLTAWHFLVERPRQVRARRWAAVEAMLAKGVDLRFESPEAYTVFFKFKNVTDSDLVDFMPAFLPQGTLIGLPPVSRLDLNGSEVSAARIAEFEKATGIEVVQEAASFSELF